MGNIITAAPPNSARPNLQSLIPRPRRPLPVVVGGRRWSQRRNPVKPKGYATPFRNAVKHRQGAASRALALPKIHAPESLSGIGAEAVRALCGTALHTRAIAPR